MRPPVTGDENTTSSFLFFSIPEELHLRGILSLTQYILKMLKISDTAVYEVQGKSNHGERSCAILDDAPESLGSQYSDSHIDHTEDTDNEDGIASPIPDGDAGTFRTGMRPEELLLQMAPTHQVSADFGMTRIQQVDALTTASNDRLDTSSRNHHHSFDMLDVNVGQPINQQFPSDQQYQCNNHQQQVKPQSLSILPCKRPLDTFNKINSKRQCNYHSGSDMAQQVHIENDALRPLPPDSSSTNQDSYQATTPASLIAHSSPGSAFQASNQMSQQPILLNEDMNGDTNFLSEFNTNFLPDLFPAFSPYDTNTNSFQDFNTNFTGDLVLH